MELSLDPARTRAYADPFAKIAEVYTAYGSRGVSPTNPAYLRRMSTLLAQAIDDASASAVHRADARLFAARLMLSRLDTLQRQHRKPEH
jgi:hypothetical protein